MQEKHLCVSSQFLCGLKQKTSSTLHSQVAPFYRWSRLFTRHFLAFFFSFLFPHLFLTFFQVENSKVETRILYFELYGAEITMRVCAFE